MTTARMGRRDLRVDTLRGLLLVFMAIDHIASDLQIATYHIFGYVSAAEGFVFISGLVAGLVYARRRWNDGPVTAQQASWRRALALYGHHIGLFLFVWVWTAGAHAVHRAALLGGPESWAPSWRVLVAGMLMLNQPPLLDILPMYCSFMLLLPVLLWLFDRGLRVHVVAGSFAVWLLGNVLLPQTPWTIGVVATSALSVAAWQLLFVAGAAFGHAWAGREPVVPRPRAWLIAVTAAICVAGYVVRHAFVPPPIPRAALDWLTNKHSLAPLRLLNTAALFYLVYAIGTTFPRVLQWRPLAFLGKNALPVFCAHVVVAYVLASFPEVFAETPGARWMGTAVMITTLVVVAALFVKRSPKPSLAPLARAMIRSAPRAAGQKLAPALAEPTRCSARG